MELRTLGGVRFIRLKGTAAERARAHGTLLRKEAREGALVSLAKKNEWLIRRSPGPVQIPGVAASVIWLYRNVLIPRLMAGFTPYERKATRAFAGAVGLPERFCAEGIFQPDAFMLLCRLSVMKHLLPEYLGAGGVPGCTSAVTLPSWNQSGRLLACRNQDYFIVGPWEKHTTVMFHEPSEADEIPHISVSSAGIHTSGLTSMNREGLTLFTHAHFGRTVFLGGRSVVMLGDEIARSAKTVGQAIDIARKSRTVANWSYVVASARDNEAVVIEKTPSRTRVVEPDGGIIAHSNYFHSPDLGQEEALLCGAYCDDLVSRAHGIRRILEAKRGQLTPADMAAALGSQIDYFTGRERVYGNTIGVITTIKSTVFDPSAQRFWVSERGESPASLGPFLEISAERFWDEPLPEDATSWPRLQGYQPKNPALLEGLRHYREAYRAWHVNNEDPQFARLTLGHLRRAVAACPDDGNIAVQAGIVAMRVGDFDEARAFFERTLTQLLSPHPAGVRDLLLARCYDVTGARDRALPLYATYKETSEPKLKRALKSGLKRPFRRREAGRLIPDLQFPDAMQY